MVLKGLRALIKFKRYSSLVELEFVCRAEVTVRFDERNGKCTLVNARAVTDFARVGGKIMQMFEGSYKCPLENSPWIDDRSNLGGRFSINVNVIFEM